MNVPLLSPGQAVGLDVLLFVSALVFGGLFICAPMRLARAKQPLRGAVNVQDRGGIAGKLRR